MNTFTKKLSVIALAIVSICLSLNVKAETKETVTIDKNVHATLTNKYKKSQVIVPQEVGRFILTGSLVDSLDVKTEEPKPKKVVKKYKTITKITNVNLTANINDMKADIKKAMKKYKVNSKYEEWIFAMVRQESGGSGSDPFQVSEAVCGSIGCISDRTVSIDKGIKVFKQRLKTTKKVLGYEDIEITLQTYNYGTNFLQWLKKQDAKKYSVKLAKKYSKKMCGQAGTSVSTAVNSDTSACYGDYNYVNHLKRYIKVTTKKVLIES
ncbi:lysozyme family protein [Mycoplasma sp. P36-A1]|uniref:lysozyme family protein n=1 Tax=Mycoplasma sp. P36-A1 TaxID=3252900 RepID=UPI003C2D65E3